MKISSTLLPQLKEKNMLTPTRRIMSF